VFVDYGPWPVSTEHHGPGTFSKAAGLVDGRLVHSGLGPLTCEASGTGTVRWPCAITRA